MLCVFGKKYRASSFKIISCQGKLKYNMKAGNQTERGFIFGSIFLLVIFLNVVSGVGGGGGGSYLQSTM